jgi:palmitoyltransferase ZDHHC9/14/18
MSAVQLLRRRFKVWLRFLLIHVFCTPAEIIFASDTSANLLDLYIYEAIFIAIALIMYFFVFFTDPGYIPRSFDQDFSHTSIFELADIQDLAIPAQPTASGLDLPILMHTNSEEIQLRTCLICDIYKPPRSKHCYVCHRCVARFDHHCPMLGNCIGYKNHRPFWVFLALETLALVFSIYLNLKTLLDTEFRQIGRNWQYVKIAYLIASFIAIFALGVYVCALFFFHTYLAFTNQTTYEFILWWRSRSNPDPQRPPLRNFSRGMFRNIKDFFCSSLFNPVLVKTGSPRLQEEMQRKQQKQFQ